MEGVRRWKARGFAGVAGGGCDVAGAAEARWMESGCRRGAGCIAGACWETLKRELRTWGVEENWGFLVRFDGVAADNE